VTQKSEHRLSRLHIYGCMCVQMKNCLDILQFDRELTAVILRSNVPGVFCAGLFGAEIFCVHFHTMSCICVHELRGILLNEAKVHFILSVHHSWL